MTIRALCLTAFFTAAAACVSLPASAAPTQRGALSCDDGYQSKSFQIALDPPRYVRVTQISFAEPSDELMRAFQDPGEERLQVTASALHLELEAASCTVDTASRTHFLECATPANPSSQEMRLRHSSLSFTAIGKSALGASQSTTINRELQVMSVAIHAEVQQRQGTLGLTDRVIATITVTAGVGAQLRTLHLTKDLGEWTSKKDRSDWDRCLVTP